MENQTQSNFANAFKSFCIQGDQEIRARFSNQKKNMKAANKHNEIWRVFSKFSLVFKNLYGIKKIPV
jgi:hypothetical protein